ncbi:MAG TPA: glycosyltransferase family A protein [Thermoplasmata archaeon]|nr:glycosyltransferase family A protein [Thermoplasmata archaeon]
MKELPLVSVVTPTRNRPDMLREAYASLQAQTVQDFEFVISVNGRDAKSLPEARKIGDTDQRAKVLYDPHSNLSEAWNAGFKASEADVLHFFADDDLLEPRFLELGVRAFADRPELDLVGTDYVAFTGDGKAVPMPCMLTNPGAAAAGNGAPALGAFNLNVSLFRRNLLRVMGVGPGPFDPSFRTRADEDLFVRLSRSKARALHICAPLVRYRVHPGQATQGNDARHFFEHMRVANSAWRPSLRDAMAQTLWALNRRMGFFGTRVMRQMGRETAYRLSAIELLRYPELRT